MTSPSSFGNSLPSCSPFWSNLFKKPLILLSRNSLWSFNPPASCLRCWDPTVLKDLNPLQHVALLFGCPTAPACSSSSVSVPFFASRIPNTFCTISRLLPVCPFFRPGHDLENDAFSILPNFLTRILVRCIFLAASCICCIFHISYIDTYLLPHTTPSDALSPPYSDPQRSTFLSALA